MYHCVKTSEGKQISCVAPKKKEGKMGKRFIAVVLIGLLVTMFVGCKPKDEKAESKPVQTKSNTVSFQSYNDSDYFIRHRNFLGEVTTISSDLDKKDATFKIVSGLADSKYISFESVNYPNYYLRHEDFRINLHEYSDDELFKKDVTFKKVAGLAESSWSSFESYNYPGYYIRQKDYQLYIEEGSDDLFQKDATFKIVSPKWSK